MFKAFTRRYGTRKNVMLFRPDVRELLSEIGIKNEYTAQRIFSCMDEDDSGAVDYKEMASFCKMLGNGKQADRMKFIFNACDINADGHINHFEFRKLVKNIIENCHETVPSYSIIKKERDVAMFADCTIEEIAAVVGNRLSYEIFKEADKDKSDTLELKEFMFWFTRGGKIVNEFAELFKLFDLLASE